MGMQVNKLAAHVESRVQVLSDPPSKKKGKQIELLRQIKLKKESIRTKY